MIFFCLRLYIALPSKSSIFSNVWNGGFTAEMQHISIFFLSYSTEPEVTDWKEHMYSMKTALYSEWDMLLSTLHEFSLELGCVKLNSRPYDQIIDFIE